MSWTETASSWHRRYAQSADGSTLAMYLAGTGGRRAVVIVAEPGADPNLWRSQLDYLGDRLAFATWDHRGCRASVPAAAAGLRLGIGAQLEDLVAVIEAAGASELVIVGCGVGVRIAVQAAHRLGPCVAALVLVSGTPGRHPRQRAAPVAALLAPHADPWCARTRSALATQDGWTMLAGLEQPTLVIAGGRDPDLPRAVAQQLARQVPDSEMLLVPPAGPLVFAEYPDLVNLALERFLGDVDWC